MRRMLAITLLIAFGSSLVVPIFAATPDPEASLPACCRSHGVHHCSMIRMSGHPVGPAFAAPPCPFYPMTSAPARCAAASLTISLLLPYERLLGPARTTAARRPARTFRLSAHLKRGPPLFLV